MIKKLYLYTFCLFFLAVTSFGDQKKSQTEYVPGEWIIKFKDEVRSQQEVLNLQQNVTNFLKTKLGQKYKINITVLQTTLRYNKVKITPIVDLNKIIQILKSHPLVEYAEPNY
ncbi:MAG: hypothetical protein HY843_09330, partial [Bdellovibrio sp.]|nr:hypothetical protein [Bdellovibrio sp.]